LEFALRRLFYLRLTHSFNNPQKTSAIILFFILFAVCCTDSLPDKKENLKLYTGASYTSLYYQENRGEDQINIVATKP